MSVKRRQVRDRDRLREHARGECRRSDRRRSTCPRGTTAVPVNAAVLLFASSAVMSVERRTGHLLPDRAAANRGNREVRDGAADDGRTRRSCQSPTDWCSWP